MFWFVISVLCFEAGYTGITELEHDSFPRHGNLNPCYFSSEWNPETESLLNCFYEKPKLNILFDLGFHIYPSYIQIRVKIGFQLRLFL